MQRHLNRTVTTQIANAMPFYAAEEYHQDFAERNPAHYNAYRVGCGRDRRLRELWGTPRAADSTEPGTIDSERTEEEQAR